MDIIYHLAMVRYFNKGGTNELGLCNLQEKH